MESHNMDRGHELLMKESILEAGDARYSMKWVERVILGILTLFGIAIVGRLIVLLIPAIPTV